MSGLKSQDPPSKDFSAELSMAGVKSVGESAFEDLPSGFGVKIEALGLAVVFVPGEIEPFESIKNGIDGGLGVAFEVCIVEA